MTEPPSCTLLDPATTLNLLERWMQKAPNDGSDLYRASLVHVVAMRGQLIHDVDAGRWDEMLAGALAR